MGLGTGGSLTFSSGVTIYDGTGTSTCNIFSNNMLLGLHSFRRPAEMGYSLSISANSVIKITTSYDYYLLKFSVALFCTLHYTCSNSNYPYYNGIDKFCYDVCPSGTFLNETSNKCITCSINTYFYQDQCVGSCPITTYLDTANNRCDKCTEPCLNCNVSSTDCMTCVIGAYFLINKCYYSCPDFYYSNSGSGLC